MTAWMARIGFLLMGASMGCLAGAIVSAVVDFESRGYLRWQVAAYVALALGLVLVFTATEVRRRQRGGDRG